MRVTRVALVSALVLAAVAGAVVLRPSAGFAALAWGAGLAQGQAPAAPPPYLVLSKDGRQPLAVTPVNGRDMLSLDEVGRAFGLTVREDPVARGLVLTLQNRTIVLSSAQGLASIGGRVVSLSSPPVRSGTSWMVPVDLIDRALALIHQPKLDVRPRARLILIGDVRVPRLTIRTESQANQTRVIVDIAPATAHTVVQEPGRLVVRFEAEALDVELPPAAPDPQGLLQGIRLLPNAPTVAVDVGPRFFVYRAVDSVLEGGLARLTLDLLPQPSLTTAAPGPAAPGQPGQPAPPPPLVTESAASIRTVVIDPGHGGEYEGSKGPGGSLEKHITLAVAKQLKAALEARLGVRVLLTRDTDRTVELDERAAFANNNKADLFVSLHTNASVSSAPVGAEVFYLSLNDYSQEAKRLAIAENGGALPTVAGGDRQIEVILWEMAQMQHIEQSAAYADLVEQQLRARVRMRSRAIQQAPFRVLVGANMPAVIVEMGFISNPGEEKLLNSPAFQQSIVQALVESVARFRDQLDRRRQPAVTAAPSPASAPAQGPPRAGAPQVPEPRSPR